MWQFIEGLDINESDKVYQCSDSGRCIKTRIVRLPDDTHDAAIRAKNLFLHVSGSACDAQGKALPDGVGGHCIAPERAVTLSIGEMQADALARKISLAQAFVEACEKLRVECCEQSKGIDEVIALRMAIPLKPAAVSSEGRDATPAAIAERVAQESEPINIVPAVISDTSPLNKQDVSPFTKGDSNARSD